MKRGDIYLVSLDPTLGHEQRGQRPVLVISPTEFNAVTKLPVVLPITSGGEFARRISFAVPSRPLELCAAISRAYSTCRREAAEKWIRYPRRFWVKCWPRSLRCLNK
jgi:mRNA-degrading endonuclease toxin of MazEF toxin-antitoxin module